VTAEEDLSIGGLANGVPPQELFAMSGNTLEAAKQKMLDLKPFQLSSGDEVTATRFRTAQAWIGSSFGLGVGALINEQVGHTVAESVIPKEGAVGALDALMIVKDARNRENAVKFIDFFGGKENQISQFKLNRYALSNKASVDAIIEKGGNDAAFLKQIKSNDPEVAAGLAELRQPDDAQAWAAAWDEIQGA
jgi:spermidine/putrescine-binding protein